MKITDGLRIAGKFYNYFTSIAQELVYKIHSPQNTFISSISSVGSTCVSFKYKHIIAEQILEIREWINVTISYM